MKFIGRTGYSWEPEEEIPQHLVAMYRSNEARIDIQIEETNYNGQMSTSFYGQKTPLEVPTCEPAAKKSKTSIEIPNEG